MSTNQVVSPAPAVSSGPSAPVTVALAPEAAHPNASIWGEKDVPNKAAFDGSSDAHVDEKNPVEDKEEPKSEVPSDVLIETLLEEILNDYSAGGPFVHRLKAYRTPSDEIMIREETIKIEVGTKLEMSPFSGCQFYRLGLDGFAIDGENHSNKIELSRRMANKTQGNVSRTSLGRNQIVDIDNKAVSTYSGETKLYEFNVGGWVFKVSSDGSTLSRSKLSASFTGSGCSQTININSDMEDMKMSGLDAGTSTVGRNMGKIGQNLGKMSQNLNRISITQTSPFRRGRQISLSDNSTSGAVTVGGTVIGSSVTLDSDGNVLEIKGDGNVIERDGKRV